MKSTEEGDRIAAAMMSDDTKLIDGDTVVYTAKFLRSVGAYTGDLPFAQGKIVSMTDRDPKKFGGFAVIEVDWGTHQQKTLECNLIRKDRRHLEAR